MPKRTDIKSILIIGVMLFALPMQALAGECKDKGYVAFSLTAYHEYVIYDAMHDTDNFGGAGAEDFNAMIDMLVKESPECLLEVFPSLNLKIQALIIYRAKQFGHDDPECAKDAPVDYNDRSWCMPSLRELNDTNCFDKNGKPFNWCKAYPPILEKLEKMYHAS